MNRKRLWLTGVVLLFVLATLVAAQQQKPTPTAPKPPEGTKVLRDLEYMPGGHERNMLDLYLPAKSEGPLPVVVWIHGGGWRNGNKDGCPGMFLTRNGYAVASINYRLSQHAKFPAQIEDCKAAIRWLRANASKYNLDAHHIGVWGASAGGHLVALLGTAGDAKDLEGRGGNLEQSSKVQAVCDWFGPTDFLKFGPGADKPDSAAYQLIGGPMSQNKEKAAQASPVLYVSKDSPPFLIMHGDKDPLVPLSQSEELAEALKKAGIEATLHIFKGAAHGGAEFRTPETMKMAEEFFDKHLKKNAKK